MPPTRPAAGTYAVLALCLLGAALLYGGTLSYQFTNDDHPYVENNAAIRSLDSVAYLAFHPLAEGETLRGHLYRPFAALVEYLVGSSSGFTPAPFRVANILLAALNAWTLYLLLAALFPGPSPLAAALLFLAHPLHTEVVASVVGITELLGSQLVLFALWCLATRRRRHLAAAAAALAFLLALLSKETTVVFPVLALLVLRVQKRAPRDCLRLAWVAALPLAVYFALRFHVVGTLLRSPHVEFDLLDNPLCGLGTVARVANAIAILPRYLGLALLPVGLSADYSLSSIPLLPSPFSPLAAGAVALLVALAAAAWAARRRQPAVTFGLILCGVGLLPASNLLFCGGTIFGERFAYLPSAGVVLATSALAFAAAGGAPAGRRAAAGLLLLAGVGFGCLTVARHPVWRDDLALFSSVLERFPDNAKAHYNVAVLEVRRGQADAGRRHAARAIAIYPDYIEAYILRARLEAEAGEGERAEATLLEALRRHRSFEDVYIALGTLYSQQNRLPAAAAIYREGMTRLPASAKIPYNLALVYLSWDDPESAEPLLRRALASVDLADARFALGFILANRGEWASASQELEHALGATAFGPAAAKLLALCQIRMGHYAAAATALATPELAGSTDPEVALMGAWAFLQLGDRERARGARDRLGPLDEAACQATAVPDLCAALAAALP